MRHSDPPGVEVAVVVTTAADLDAFIALRRYCLYALKCAKLRMVYPRLGVPVFRFAGELLDVNRQGEKTVHGCVGRRRSRSCIIS